MLISRGGRKSEEILIDELSTLTQLSFSIILI